MKASEQEYEGKKSFAFASRFSRFMIITIIIGLVLRFVFTPLLSYEYDNYYWSVIIQNINSGNHLYEIEGFYYTPVWGYILGSYDILWSYLSPIGEMGLRVPELFGIEEADFIYHSATVVNPLFLSGIKILLIAADILVGYLIYQEVLRITESRRKSEYAFALWFICPIVLYMCGVQCMFDGISALLIMIGVILARRDLNLLSGVMLGLAAMLKVLPAACIPILLAYVVVKNRTRIKECITGTALMVIGMVVSIIVVILPNILNNSIDKVLAFATNRIFSSMDNMITFIALGIAAILLIALIVYLMNRYGHDELDNKLNLFILFALVIAVIATRVPAPQYCIVLIPFLAIQIASYDKGYMICWWILSIATAVKAIIMNNFGLLAMSAKYYGFPQYEWIVSLVTSFSSEASGTSAMSTINIIGDMAYTIGLVLILLFMVKPFIERKIPIAGKIIGFIKSIGKGKEISDDA